MTSDELRAARAKLGLSTAGLAKRLELGSGSGRTVRRWEAGDRPIPGPVKVALELLLKETPKG